MCIRGREIKGGALHDTFEPVFCLFGFGFGKLGGHLVAMEGGGHSGKGYRM